MSDPIEDRVDQALKAAAKAASYDGPEFMALRQAVEDLKLDRRLRLSRLLERLSTCGRTR